MDGWMDGWMDIISCNYIYLYVISCYMCIYIYIWAVFEVYDGAWHWVYYMISEIHVHDTPDCVVFIGLPDYLHDFRRNPCGFHISG